MLSFKVQFFLWTVVLNKISTMNMLWRNGLVLSSICLFCYGDTELATHILIHCPFTLEIWCGIAKDFGVNFIAPRNLMDLLLGWKLKAFNCFGKRLWKVVPAVVCWAVWNERNNRVFRGTVEPAYQVYRRVKDMIIFWIRRCKGYEGLPSGSLVRDWQNSIGIM